MIDPTLLTETNGFVPGCIVELSITTNTGEIARRIDFWENLLPLEYKFPRCDSIKVLTGPMAIWNFAPKWADECMIWPFEGNIEWLKKDSERKTIGMTTFLKRPFWA